MRIRIFPLAMSLLLTSLSSQSQAVGSIEGRARVNDAGVVLDPNLVLREQSNRAAMVSLTALEALGINSLALYSGINARVSENSNSPQGVTACEQHLRYSGFGDGEARILCRQASANPTNPTTGGSTNPNPPNQTALRDLAQMDLVAIPGILGLAWHIAKLPKNESQINAARMFLFFAFQRRLSLHHSTIQSGITLPYRVLNLNSNANGLPREIPPELERSVFLSSLYSVADVLLHLSNSTQNAGTIRQRLRDTRDAVILNFGDFVALKLPNSTQNNQSQSNVKTPRYTQIKVTQQQLPDLVNGVSGNIATIIRNCDYKMRIKEYTKEILTIIFDNANLICTRLNELPQDRLNIRLDSPDLNRTSVFEVEQLNHLLGFDLSRHSSFCYPELNPVVLEQIRLRPPNTHIVSRPNELENANQIVNFLKYPHNAPGITQASYRDLIRLLVELAPWEVANQPPPGNGNQQRNLVKNCGAIEHQEDIVVNYVSNLNSQNIDQLNLLVSNFLQKVRQTQSNGSTIGFRFLEFGDLIPTQQPGGNPNQPQNIRVNQGSLAALALAYLVAKAKVEHTTYLLAETFHSDFKSLSSLMKFPAFGPDDPQTMYDILYPALVSNITESTYGEIDILRGDSLLKLEKTKDEIDSVIASIGLIANEFTS